MKRKSTPARIGAAVLLVPAVLVLAGGPALAADNVVISNSETVQAHLNADGTLKDARVYEQIGLQGKGTVTIKNPVSTGNLRNLDGFGSFEVEDGKMVSTQSVDGETHLRGVSDYNKKLPLKVSVAYKLDGKTVTAGDVVGKAGRLDVHYKVENVTGKDQDVTYDDGTGKKITQTQKVVIPMVGSLTTVLPSNFLDVASNEANMAGDGHGQTKMSFTMTMFGPIGNPISEFGYSATVTGGLIPDATISALPVSPLDSPSFKGGAASYKGGADKGVELTAGATEIDANVLKLRDGAQTLIGGLIQLRDGAQKLNSGLDGKATPGAEKLAAGAGKLDAGAKELKDGLGRASAKAPALLSGLAKVSDGLKRVDAGLVKLYGGIGQLPAESKPLHSGIAKMLEGLGDAGTPGGTLAYAVSQIRVELAEETKPDEGLDRLKKRVDGSKSGVDGFKDQVRDALAPKTGRVALLRDGVRQAKALASCHGDPACQKVLDGVSGQLDKLEDNLTAAQDGLGGISGGLGIVSPDLATLKTKLSKAQAGLIRVACGLDNTAFKGAVDYCAKDVDAKTPGIQKAPGLRQGLDLVDRGVTKLVDKVVGQVQGGVGQGDDLFPAQKTLRGGVHAAMDGVDLIGEGGLTLADGLDRLDAGAGKLKAGTGELTDGAKKLASGLGDAADGSRKLSDGLVKATEKGKAVPEGASRLSAEGTSQLGVKGKATASEFGLKYAVIAAGAERAKTEAMAYGVPDNASGTTAYSLEIAGANGDGGTSLNRGVGALALFSAGGGLLLLRRRLV